MVLVLLPGNYALTRLARDAEPPPLPAGPLAALVRDRDASLAVLVPGDRLVDATAALIS